jgi:RHS repeat-associated protein
MWTTLATRLRDWVVAATGVCVVAVWCAGLASAAPPPLATFGGNGSGVAPRSSAVDARVDKWGSLSGRRIARLSSAMSDTWRTAGGGFVTRTYLTPVNYRDSKGEWAPIQDSFVADSSAGSGYVQNQANAWHVHLPGRLGKSRVSFSVDGATVGFSLANAADVPIDTSGSTASYKHAFTDADVEYQAASNDVKERIVLSSASAPSSYTFPLDLPSGWTARMQNGAVVFFDASGKRTEIAIAPATVADSSSGFQDPFAHVTMHLAKMSDGADDVVVSVDKSWLESPARQFPVTIDPTVTITQQGDCWIASWAPTTNACPVAYMDLGGNSTGLARMLLGFSMSGIPQNALVLQAKLGVYFTAGTAMAGASVYQITPHDPTGGATWNSYNGTSPWTTAGGDYASTVQDVESVPASAGYVNWYLTNMVQSWVSTPSSNDGLLIKDDSSGVIRSAYNEQGTTNQSLWPYLQVTWSYRTGELPASPMVNVPIGDGMTLQVNAANGNGNLSTPVMDIAGTGTDFDMGTWFSTIQPNWADEGGEAGFGFIFDPGPGYQLYMEFNGSSSGAEYEPLIYGSDGEVEVFQAQSDGTYIAPGLDAALTYYASGSTEEWIETLPSGVRYIFQGNGGDSNYGALLYEQDRNGNTITYNWGAVGSTPRLTSIVDTQGRTITPTYDANGMVVGWTDSTGRSMSFSVNSSNVVQSMTDANGGTISYGYTSSGALDSITDPDGDQTTISYDSSGRITSIVRVSNTSTGTGPTYQFAYGSRTSVCPASPDPSNPIIAQTVATDPNGNQTTYCDDADDRVAAEIDPAGNVTTSVYNAVDAPTSTTVSSAGGSAAQTTSTSYNTLADGDASAEPTSSTITNTGFSLSQGTATYPTSGANDQLPTSTTDPQGNQTTYSYDAYGNPTSIVDPLSASGPYQNSSQDEINLTYSSSHFGWLTQSTDPDGHATSYGYDGEGNLTSITPPAPLGQETFAYDGLSRMTSQTDGDGNTTTYTYNPLDEVSKTTYQDGTIVSDNYDADGNLTSEVDPSGIESNTYNNLGELTQTVLPTGQTLGYGYDNDGNLTSFTDGAGTYTYTYNNLSQLTKLTEPSGAVTTFAYNTLGQRISTSFPNGVTETYSYDPADQPLTMVAKNASGTTLASETYTYTTGSTTTELIQTATDQAGNATSYTYDPLDRLVEAKTTNGSTTVSDYKYTYDGAGNRLTEIVNGATTSYTYNAADELTAIGPTSLSYDADGNQTQQSNGSGTISYNARDQTSQIGSSPMTFFGSGEVVQTGSGSATLLNSDLGLSAIANGANVNYVTLDSEGNPIGEATSSGSYYFITDPQGSVIDVTNSTGLVTRTNSYDPYGSVSTVGTGPSDLGYLGAYVGQAGGVDHFGARLFDPDDGRWTQPDPTASSLVQDPTQADAYVYASDDPINVTDPSGTCGCEGEVLDHIQRQIDVCNNMREANRHNRRNLYYFDAAVYSECQALYRRWGTGGPYKDGGSPFSCSDVASAVGGALGGLIGAALGDVPGGYIGGAIGGFVGSKAC